MHAFISNQQAHQRAIFATATPVAGMGTSNSYLEQEMGERPDDYVHTPSDAFWSKTADLASLGGTRSEPATTAMSCRSAASGPSQQQICRWRVCHSPPYTGAMRSAGLTEQMLKDFCKELSLLMAKTQFGQAGATLRRRAYQSIARLLGAYRPSHVLVQQQEEAIRQVVRQTNAMWLAGGTLCSLAYIPGTSNVPLAGDIVLKRAQNRM